MRSMQWQLGILGTISAFAYRQGKPRKTCLCFRCLFHCAHAQGDFSKNLKQKRHDARLKGVRFCSKNCCVTFSFDVLMQRRGKRK